MVVSLLRPGGHEHLLTLGLFAPELFDALVLRWSVQTPTAQGKERGWSRSCVGRNIRSDRS